MIAEMTVFLAQLLAKLLGLIVRAVAGAIPRTESDVQRLANRLYPILLSARRRVAQKQAEELKKLAREEYGIGVSPAPVRPYPRDSVVKLIRRTAGLDVRSRPVDRSGLDDDSRKESGRQKPPATVDEFIDALNRGAEQHVRSAGREMVIDTAEQNRVTDEQQAEWDEEESRRNRETDPDGDAEVIPIEQDTRDAKEVLEEAKRERERIARENDRPRGPVLGWARVLSGEVNCAFCAMLASRGAVYKSAQSAGFIPHDRCDCGVTLVVKGQAWTGDREAAALEELWQDAKDNPNEYEQDMMDRFDLLDTPAKRFRSRYEAMIRNGEVERFKHPDADVAQERLDRMRNKRYSPQGATHRRRAA